ncbi:MAG: hypothetical protein JJE09_02200 [Bacteroidia bacterium]|nr:hypothetical protein [Bacteroidia bacterium]
MSIHNYNNRNNSFLGLEGAIIDIPLLANKFLLSPRAVVWIQPKDQSFTTTNGSLGGLLNLRGSYKLGLIYPYIEIEGKTAGWAMGNVFLEDNISLSMGLSLRLN